MKKQKFENKKSNNSYSVILIFEIQKFRNRTPDGFFKKFSNNVENILNYHVKRVKKSCFEKDVKFKMEKRNHNFFNLPNE